MADIGFILKVKPKKFAHRLDAGCEKKEVKKDSKVLSLFYQVHSDDTD